MKTCVVVFILLFAAATGFAQAPDTLWTRTCGGPGADQANAVCRAGDGGFLFAGYTMPASDADFYTLRVSPNGDTLWTHRYGGPNWDIAYSACPTSGGGFAIAGYTVAPGSGQTMYLVKINPGGDTLWTRTYGGAGSSVVNSVLQSSDGGLLLAGTRQDHVTLIKTDSAGQQQWTHTYNSGGPEHVVGAQQTHDGGYIVAATTWIQPGVPDIYVVKTDSLGDTLWTHLYGGVGTQVACSIQECDVSGGYIIGGTAVSSEGNQDYYLVRIDNAGTVLWTRSYGGAGYELAAGVRQCVDGGYMIAGTSDRWGGTFDVHFVRTSQSGDIMWERHYGGTESDMATALEAADGGGYVVAGSTTSYGQGGMDFYTLLLAGTSGFGGIITDVVTHQPIRNAIVSVVGQPYGAHSDSLGWYYLFVPPATYDLSISGQCVGRDTVTGRVVLPDSISPLNLEVGVPEGIVEQSSLTLVAHNHVPTTGALHLVNAGEGILDYSVTCTPQFPASPWLTVMPAQGSVAPGDSFDVTVQVLADTADDGVYDYLGFLEVHMNSCPDSVRHIPVSASILDADPASATVPATYALSAYPNPFNPSTTLRFDIPQAGRITLAIYDITGRTVCTLEDGVVQAGYHRVAFDGRALASGLYFARLSTPGATLTHKLLLLR